MPRYIGSAPVGTHLFELGAVLLLGLNLIGTIRIDSGGLRKR
nr:L593 [uncultured bacterium]